MEYPFMKYGIAVGLIQNDKFEKKIYLSRRTAEHPQYPKKWQIINGPLKGCESSQQAVQRIVLEETQIEIPIWKITFVSNLHLKTSNHFYYVYMVHLDADQFPTTSSDGLRSMWRSFRLEDAKTLDVIPGTRPLLIRLDSTHKRYVKLTSSLGGQLTELEQNHRLRLGPKMSRSF